MILEQIEAGERLEVITEWCGIPVKMKLTVKWVAVKDKVICLDIVDCKFRHVFRMSSEPIYIKIEKPRQAYGQCEIYNREYRDELILLVEYETPPPPVIVREYVRVEYCPNITLTLSINLPNGSKVPATGELKNISADQKQVRMGFKLYIARPHDEILRRYIMDRQRELLNALLYA
jgi:hypothetical protein